MIDTIARPAPEALRPGGDGWCAVDALALDPDTIQALSDDEALRVLSSLQQVRARAGAIEARVLARFDEVRPEEIGADYEVALEMRISRPAAEDRINTARRLVMVHPVVLDAMHAGDVDPYIASKIVEWTSNLEDIHAYLVDKNLAGRLAKNLPAIRRIVRREILKVDPDGLAARTRRARSGRQVRLIPGDDGVSRLIADLQAEIATAAYAAIDREARRLRRVGDIRSLDQLRADITGERLTGTTKHRKHGKRRDTSGGAQVFLHMPIGTALGITDDGCELAGYGPIPGPIARQIMADENSIWRKVIRDPGTGAVQDVGRSRYRPPQAIRDIVNARDCECPAPGCHRAAQASQFDHVIGRKDGGGTSVLNGQAACEYHNQLKEDPRWGIGFEGGEQFIVTPTGRQYKFTHIEILPPRQRPPKEPEPEPPPAKEPLPDDPPF